MKVERNGNRGHFGSSQSNSYSTVARVHFRNLHKLDVDEMTFQGDRVMRKQHKLVGSRVLAASIAIGLMLMGGQAFADVPVSMTHQGRLLDDDGAAKTGDVDLEFALYDAADDGTILWSDNISTVLNDQGVYSVTLGDEAQPIDSELLQDGEVYLALTVDGDEMSPRMELTSVPFASLASTAEVANSVVDGAITSDSLAEGAITGDVIESVGWEQITDVPTDITDSADTLAELGCGAQEVALYDGSEWTCSDLDFPTYSGEDFATSNQDCSADDVVVGIDAGGDLVCVPQQDTTYSGSDFATSAQECSGNDVAVGVDSGGNLICMPQQDTTYSGSDFATSAQECSGNDVAVGITSSGTLMCTTVDDTTYDAGTGLALSADNEFSVDTGYLDSNYLRGDGTINVEGSGNFDGNVAVNANATGSGSWIRFRDTGGFDTPRMWHNEPTSRLRFLDIDEVSTAGDLGADGDLSVGGQVVGDRLGVNLDGDPQTAMHVKGDTLGEGISLEASDLSNTDLQHAWTMATHYLTGDLTFRFTDDIYDEDFSNRAYISVDDGSFNQFSDRRMKRDIEGLDRVLNDIMALRPVQYRAISADDDSSPSVGFIAQEVEKIFPELVKYTEEDDQYWMGYADFGVLSIQAIQEQQEIIDEQAEQLDELEARLERLEAGR